jgi:hypothetical protein
MTKAAAAAVNTKSVHIVVQRYRSCQVLLEETDWVSVGSHHHINSIGNGNDHSQGPNDDKPAPAAASVPASHCGLLVYVSFASSTDKAVVQQAALTILNLSVLTTGLWGDGVSATCSVLELAARGGGHAASLVLVPQANLISKVKSQGKSIQYHGQIGKDQGEELYLYFCECVRAAILEEQCRVRQQVLPDDYIKWKGIHNFSTGTTDTSAPSSSPLPVDPSTPPDQLFRHANYASKYASWDDETGMPLTDVAGEPLTKSALKKLCKLQEGHAKRHAKWKLQNPHHDDHNQTVAATVNVPAAVSDVSAAVSGIVLSDVPMTTPSADSRSPEPTVDETVPTTALATDTDQLEWQSAVDPAFCHVVAGSFGKRQGLEMQSDMGPFCHVLQV